MAEGFKPGGVPSINIEVASRTGKSEKTVRRHLDMLKIQPPSSEIEFPDFPDEDIPVSDIVDHMTRRFEKRKASHDAHTWFPVKVKENKPIGILWFGDPHVDDNGANWSILRRHCELCRTTDGLYGANIGDTTNAWAGRLAHLYAKQDTSVGTAQKLAAWFMLESGVKWILWLLGNHDAWGDGSAVLAQMAKRFGTKAITCHDWEARFRIVFPNGAEFKINAAHDFKGHSQWNSLHGPMKAAQLSEDAHLFICGHKHEWSLLITENARRNIRQVIARVRGYKFLDEYARRGGFPEQQGGCGILTIFDPIRRTLHAFEDVEEGAAYLTWLRRAK